MKLKRRKRKKASPLRVDAAPGGRDPPAVTRDPGDALSFPEKTNGNRGKPVEGTPDEKKPDERRPDEKVPDEKSLDEKNPDEKRLDDENPDEKSPDVTGEKSPDVTGKGMPVEENPVVQEEEKEINTRTRGPTDSVTEGSVYWSGEHGTPESACELLPLHPAAQARGETNGTGETGVQELPKGGETLMDPLVRAEVVIGEATKQLLIESNLTLSQPALKIRNITAEIRDLTTELIPDKVIIQGLLHKQIFFVGEDNIVHHQTEEAPFSTFVDVFGAEPGMNIQIHPTVETILFNLLNPTLLHQKVVTEFFVKVTAPTQINIREGNGPLVRLDQVIGEATKQELLENLVTLESPAIKI
ncbi:MAG: DUF3794 domain-containing protein, partial [Firmicutes bacterium]|nr:DUF3794 domain-containing protein [Bacillota bacterium]